MLDVVENCSTLNYLTEKYSNSILKICYASLGFESTTPLASRAINLPSQTHHLMVAPNLVGLVKIVGNLFPIITKTMSYGVQLYDHTIRVNSPLTVATMSLPSCTQSFVAGYGRVFNFKKVVGKRVCS